MYPPPWLALIIIVLGASPSYAPPPPHASTSTVHETSTLDAYLPQETIVFPDADLRNECLFKGEGRTYDLCPLMDDERIVDVEMEVPGNHSGLKTVQRQYRVMLGTNRIVTGPHARRAPSLTWVFLTESDRWSGPGDIRGVSLPRGVGSLVISAYQFRSPGVEFRISLTKGAEQGGVNFAFVCAEEEGKLEFSGERDEIHHFVWRTRYACPVSTDESLLAAENDGEGEEETAKEDLKNGDLPVGGVSRRWMGVMLLLVGCLLITASVLISSPHARQYILTRLQSAGYTILPFLTNIKHLTKPVAKHFPHFRVGERRLVRWAQEDMALDGDEDFMVNSGSETGRDWNTFGAMDEYIPLKASPTGSTLIGGSYSTYGSVQFEGLDVDESGVDMGPAPEGGLKKLIRSASETASVKVKGLFR